MLELGLGQVTFRTKDPSEMLRTIMYTLYTLKSHSH